MEGEAGVPPEITGITPAESAEAAPVEAVVSGSQPEAQNSTLLSQNEARELLGRISPRERVARYLTAGLNLIRGKYNQGFFDSGKTIGYKEGAERAQTYNGVEVNADSSKAHKAILGSLEQLPDEAARGIRAELASYTWVRVGEKIYTLEEWNEVLAGTTPEERTRLEGEALYGFKFPGEQVSATEQKNTLTPEELVITTQISTLEAQIKAAKERGESTKAQEQLLRTLRLAQAANGELGALLKVKAISDLEATGVKGLEGVIKGFESEVSQAQQKLWEHFRSLGIDENQVEVMKGLVGKEGLDALIQRGFLEKVEGLDEKVFGRKLEEKELEGLLDTHLTPEQKINYIKKYGKTVGIGLLLLLLMSALELPQALRMRY